MNEAGPPFVQTNKLNIVVSHQHCESVVHDYVKFIGLYKRRSCLIHRSRGDSKIPTTRMN